ncbi:hypothetical protein MOF30_25710 [Peribacillus frigoritolerans]|nr:hypothetical protein [Peribacillus frigoritolerans]MCY9141810.1 hypothetical protein [Peribacillus frigoritolerans]
MLANPAAVPVDVETEVNQGCPESRVDRETAVQDKLDLHTDTLGTYTWSFTSIRLNVISYEIWTQRVWARKAFILENGYISGYGDIST